MELEDDKIDNIPKPPTKHSLHKHLLGNTRCVSDFDKLLEIGEGTYGTVFKARDRLTG